MKRINDAFIEKWEVKSGFSKRILLASDVHFDSPHCDRKLFKKHLDEAKVDNADVWIFGDLFDAMGGKKDPRGLKSVIRKENLRDDYFNSIVEDLAEFLQPYKEIIKFISMGNHEESVLRHGEISLLGILNYLLGGHIAIGDYYGWLRILYENGSRGKSDGSVTIYYNHGVGGDSAITKGSIKAARRDMMIDADIYISGHTHQGLSLPTGKRRLNANSNEVVDWRQHLVLKTYENDSGFMKRNELNPHLLGAHWLEFSYSNKDFSYIHWDAK